ncbi:methylenetetrahydrofolate reductase [Calderihabitans maritimus]|uniref:Methylenetetrahydrofolate reductase n=1 Tax=Calderihabitans maritimus TaxID=1246530 RepID=A0A1Z5HTZ9_9FIRM|nr:methylenetetrahydrofolate reductase [Calderihabitans maritimus]GAW92750.1 5,10-methylenetetrahydrofolate reductase [Calderihabitans maritimus]
MSLAEILETKDFVVTVELCPPIGTTIQPLLDQAEKLKSVVDAFNVTDNQRAVTRMSPVAICHFLEERGITSICQFTCRDRNRLALQSEMLSAAALGIKNLLLITGDHTLLGDCPEAKPVFDLDSVQLMATANKLNSGKSLAGTLLNGRTSFYIGGVVNPAPEVREMQIWKLARKVNAGMKFVQTQAIYDSKEFIKFLEDIRDFNIHVLAGIIPLKSAKMARFLNSKIPGIQVPEHLIQRLERAANPKEEGIRIARELIDELRNYCKGVHIMPLGMEEHLPELLGMPAAPSY